MGAISPSCWKVDSRLDFVQMTTAAELANSAILPCPEKSFQPLALTIPSSHFLQCSLSLERLRSDTDPIYSWAFCRHLFSALEPVVEFCILFCILLQQASLMKTKSCVICRPSDILSLNLHTNQLQTYQTSALYLKLFFYRKEKYLRLQNQIKGNRTNKKLVRSHGIKDLL